MYLTETVFLIFSHKIIDYWNMFDIHTSLVRITDLVSNTTYVVCVNFVHKWRDLQFKVDSERKIFWETFHANFICSQSFCQKSAERKSAVRFILFIFYTMLRKGYFPASWKLSDLVIVSKPDKDITQVALYRPISLLPILSKMFDEMLLNHIWMPTS